MVPYSLPQPGIFQNWGSSSSVHIYLWSWDFILNLSLDTVSGYPKFFTPRTDSPVLNLSLELIAIEYLTVHGTVPLGGACQVQQIQISPPNSAVRLPNKNLPASLPSFVPSQKEQTQTFLKGKVLLPQSCPTPYNPMDCNLPGFSVHGILQDRILE